MHVCKYYSKSTYTYNFSNNYNYYQRKETSIYLGIVMYDFILKLLPFLILP